MIDQKIWAAEDGVCGCGGDGEGSFVEWRGDSGEEDEMIPVERMEGMVEIWQEERICFRGWIVGFGVD